MKIGSSSNLRAAFTLGSGQSQSGRYNSLRDAFSSSRTSNQRADVRFDLSARNSISTSSSKVASSVTRTGTTQVGLPVTSSPSDTFTRAGTFTINDPGPAQDEVAKLPQGNTDGGLTFAGTITLNDPVQEPGVVQHLPNTNTDGPIESAGVFTVNASASISNAQSLPATIPALGSYNASGSFEMQASFQLDSKKTIA